MWRRSSMLGQLTLTSMAVRPSTPASRPAASAKSSTRWPQMLTTVRAPAAGQAGQVVSHPGLDPGALEPDAVDHPGAGLVDPGRRVARPRLDRQRLDHHRAERGERAVGLELVGVAGGARGRHHRVGQDRASRPATDRSTSPPGGGPPRPGPPWPTGDPVTPAAPAAHRLIRRWYSCSERTDSGWAIQSAMPAAAARAAATVVRHGTRWARAVGPDVEPVGPGAAAPRRVDDQLHLAPGDELDGVDLARLGLPHLGHHGGRPAMPSASSRAAVPEVAARSKPRAANWRAASRPAGLVPVGQREEDRARRRAAGCRRRSGSWRRPARRWRRCPSPRRSSASRARAGCPRRGTG